ncbi:MAG: biotin-dependent carboxyltransferase family protein [Bacteroidota bacterium]
MGLRIIKSGIADSIQDMGRYGYQQLGIPPGGVMDRIAAAIANTLVGNQIGEPLLEMHFPAATIFFESSMMIALTGADFGAEINGKEVLINQPILVPSNAELRFTRHNKGSKVYLSVEEGFETNKWLGSSSTSFQTLKGGKEGRNLMKYDILHFKNKEDLEIDALTHLPWRASMAEFYTENQINFLVGAEYALLEKISQTSMVTNQFKVSNQSNRMGYRLEGQALLLSSKKECLSSAVSFGTIQLLPNAQMIVLMADHQTTGGYPRIGQVASSSLPTLAQVSAGETINFKLVTQEEAEAILLQQQQNLQQLQNACNFRLQEYFKNE